MNAEEIKTLEEKAREWVRLNWVSGSLEEERLAAFAQQMIDEEREKCARIAYSIRIFTNEDCYQLRNRIVAAIRQEKEQK